MAHTLSGRRARRALVEVLQHLGPGLTVIVLDARGLVLPDRGGALAEAPGQVEPPARPATADVDWMRRQAARCRAEADLAAAWTEERERRQVEGTVAHTDVVRYRHTVTGEVVSWSRWYDLLIAREAELLAEDGGALEIERLQGPGL